VLQYLIERSNFIVGLQYDLLILR